MYKVFFALNPGSAMLIFHFIANRSEDKKAGHFARLFIGSFRKIVVTRSYFLNFQIP